VLGTGLSDLVSSALSNAATIPYADLGLPQTKLLGHAGAALVGGWHGKRAVAFAGRFHLYQGFDSRAVTAPVALAREAGATLLIVTNAAGGLNAELRPGNIMLIGDQVNLTGTSPLVGSNDPNPFVEMVDAYDPALCDLARKTATRLGIEVRSGVYAGVTGPAFETQAEARWLRSLADAVGMSTVLETIRARRLGMRVLGFSVITNMVAVRTTHEEVIATSNACAPNLARLLDAIVAAL
jgi:purine-nucleoside phosphorylase